MKIAKNGSTMRQMAYARRIWGAKGSDKHAIALDVGYPESIARNVKAKIEDKRGFQNAMNKLAVESNNLALGILAEFKSRGVKDFSNKDLVGALNAIGAAWSRFNTPTTAKEEDPTKNRLRTVILQNIEHQTLNSQNPAEQVIHEVPVEETEEEIPEEENPF